MSERDELFVTGEQAAESLARIRKEFPGRVTRDEARVFAVVEWYGRNGDQIAELTAENKRLKDGIRKRIGIYRAPFKAKSRDEIAIDIALRSVADRLEAILEPKE